MSIVTPPPAIDRDRYGRPLVTPPTGGKKVAYTRCTTYIDCLEDKFNLQRWMQRMVAIGISRRPDILLGIQAHLDDKRALDRYCDDAREAAAANAAATTGTALHALTELVDRGQELPAGLAPNVVASLEKYKEATAEFTATHIEQFCVQDFLKVGGTPDRVVKYQGTSYIADLKTGSIERGALKIAMQLAVYARSQTYDISTGVRGDHGADNMRGLVIHLPVVEKPEDAVCTIHWLDLVEGWNSVIVARTVREKRALKFKDLATPFGPDLLTALETSVPLEQQIHACATSDDVRALWAAHEADWTDELTQAAVAHIATLPSAS